eukprot:5994191-Prymnesium_polylepis.1
MPWAELNRRGHNRPEPFLQPDCVPLLHDCRPRQEKTFPEMWGNLPAHMRLENAILLPTAHNRNK